MSDTAIHENDPGFEQFVEEELKGLGERAQEKGICLDCLGDRLIIELIAGMARSGMQSADILAIVGAGLDATDADTESPQPPPRRMH